MKEHSKMQADIENESEQVIDPTPEIKESWFKKATKEFLPTFLGILVAFYLNALWVDYEEKELIAELQEAVRKEIISNKEQLAKQIAYHDELMDSANYVINLIYKGEKNLPNSRFWNGIGGDHLPDAAYRTTVSTELLARMDPDISSNIGNVYSAQSNYESVLQSARFALLGKSWPQYQDWLNYMSWMSSNVGGAEKLLMEKYENALKYLPSED